MATVSSDPMASYTSQLVECRDDLECALHCTLKAPRQPLFAYPPIILTHMCTSTGCLVLNHVPQCHETRCMLVIMVVWPQAFYSHPIGAVTSTMSSS